MSADWQKLLCLHFEYPSFPATLLLSEDFSEGRMLSYLMDAWVSLGHFRGAYEPTVTRLL